MMVKSGSAMDSIHAWIYSVHRSEERRCVLVPVASVMRSPRQDGEHEVDAGLIEVYDEGVADFQGIEEYEVVE